MDDRQREADQQVDSLPSPPEGPVATVILVPTRVATPQATPVAIDITIAPALVPPSQPAPAAVPFVPARTEPPPPPPQPTQEPGGYRRDYSDTLLVLLNEQRAINGVGAVSPHGPLTAASEYYARFHFVSADAYKLDHWLDGGPGDRAWARGYCCAVGEILVTAEGSPEQMVELWMNSPSHRAIIVNGAYDDIGVACFQGPYPYPGGASQPTLCAADFGDSR